LIRKNYLATAMMVLLLTFGGLASAQTPARKPNIIMMMADDVSIWNISAYHRGMMGGSTPNIDRIETVDEAVAMIADEASGGGK
jgi:hypothetical protein